MTTASVEKLRNEQCTKEAVYTGSMSDYNSIVTKKILASYKNPLPMGGAFVPL